jgi:hypothetical protein
MIKWFRKLSKSGNNVTVDIFLPPNRDVAEDLSGLIRFGEICDLLKKMSMPNSFFGESIVSL